MTVDNIIALARNLTYTDDVQVKDSDALIYLNAVYHDIENRIVTEVDEDYFWDTFTKDSKNDTNEYQIPQSDGTTVGLNKVLRVELKYTSTDTYSNLLGSDSISNFTQYSDEYWQNNQLKQDAFFDVRDGSIFIYPKPSEVVTNGFVMHGTTTLIDLVSGGAETTIFPKNPELRAFHDILALGMTKFINKVKGELNAKNDAINEYEKEVARLIESIRDRKSLPYEPKEPNNYNLMY